LRHLARSNAAVVVPAVSIGSRAQSNRAIPARGRDARRPWREFGGCRRATAALEFVLVSGPLLLMLFGFIATNTMFYTWSVMQNNVQYAALMLATGQVTSFSSSGVTCGSSLGTTQVEYYACSGLPGWATFTATATETCSVPNVSVTLSVNASAAGLANIYSLFSGKTLSAQSTTMKQGNCP
jgi:Flp pilus assembly protein TadG